MRLKRILALVLCFAMVLSTMSFNVFAEDITLGGDIDLSGQGGSSEGGSSEETDAVFTVTCGVFEAQNVNTLEEALNVFDLWAPNMSIFGYPVITLNADYEFDAPVVVDGDYPITIDLNGHTMTYNGTVMGEAMITNKGTLTINDSSDPDTGVINYNYTGEADSSYGKGNYTISNAGTLTVNGGKITIANIRGHAKYPIDNNSTTGDAILVINGGHLYNYNTSAIRQFCNSTTNKNSVTVNGGLIEGFSAIWVQNPGKNTVNGKLEITGGEIKTTAAAYVNGTAEIKDVSSKIYCTIAGEGGAWSDDSAISITGGTINENVNFVASAPASITIGQDAVFNGYVETPAIPASAVAKIGDKEYTDLLEAFAEADNNTVTILADIILDAPVKVVKGKTVTLDLNGYTVSGTDTTEKNFGLIDNYGTLTIKDSVGTGKITLEATVNSGWNRYSAVVANTQGTLTVEGGTIEHLGGTDMAYGIDNLTNGNIGDAIAVINDGTIKSTYRGIRQFANSTTCVNSLTINGGTISGTNKAVWLQSSNAKANKGTLTITGGEVGDVYVWTPADGDASALILDANAENVTTVIDGLPEAYEIANANGKWTIEEIVDMLSFTEDSVIVRTEGQTAVLVLASYDSNEVLTDVKFIDVTEDKDINIADTGIVLSDKLVAALWDGLDTMAPLCGSVTK